MTRRFQPVRRLRLRREKEALTVGDDLRSSYAQNDEHPENRRPLRHRNPGEAAGIINATAKSVSSPRRRPTGRRPKKLEDEEGVRARGLVQWRSSGHNAERKWLARECESVAKRSFSGAHTVACDTNTERRALRGGPIDRRSPRRWRDAKYYYA